jgi:hypothetical protein
MHRHSDKLVSAPRTIDGNSRRGPWCTLATAPLALSAELDRNTHEAGRDDGR